MPRRPGWSRYGSLPDLRQGARPSQDSSFIIARFEEWNDVLAHDRGTEGILCPTKPSPNSIRAFDHRRTNKRIPLFQSISSDLPAPRPPDSDALMTNPPLIVENACIGLDGHAASPVVVLTANTHNNDGNSSFKHICKSHLKLRR